MLVLATIRYAKSVPSASNFKSFSRYIEQFWMQNRTYHIIHNFGLIISANGEKNILEEMNKGKLIKFMNMFASKFQEVAAVYK